MLSSFFLVLRCCFTDSSFFNNACLLILVPRMHLKRVLPKQCWLLHFSFQRERISLKVFLFYHCGSGHLLLLGPTLWKVCMCVNPTFKYACIPSLHGVQTQTGVKRGDAQCVMSSDRALFLSHSPYPVIFILTFSPGYPYPPPIPSCPLIPGYNQVFETSLMFHMKYFANMCNFAEPS